MSKKHQKQFDLKKLCDSAGPYPPEAFHFVHEGLGYTVHRIHDNPESMEPADRHINGRQLCLGLRDYAIETFGMMAPIVLEHWHIRRTDDFGRIVFAMIEAELMSRNTRDTFDDFRGVYDFDEAFSRNELLAHMV